MKSLVKSKKVPNGFTLIELILTIILASITFAMMFSYFGKSLTDSAAPISRLNKSMELKTVAERITEHYEQNPDLAQLKTNLNDHKEEYGSHFSVKCDFIKFDGAHHEQPIDPAEDPKDTLIVKIEHNETHEILTLLFVEPQ